MEIIFHDHHAVVSDHLRQRAASGVRRLAARLTRTVDAVVRFEQDGPTRRVEIILRTPRHRRLVAKSEGRFFGPALVVVLARLRSQMAALKSSPRSRALRTRVVTRT
ncbi:MAG TPA: HPF/RaiA family ribosome-associated protein [Gemmatimonadaceae bacterium]|nr:HPF/RaiA family ribosome-associated protein [Gemmatimonadaceae bacterium]